MELKLEGLSIIEKEFFRACLNIAGDYINESTQEKIINLGQQNISKKDIAYNVIDEIMMSDGYISRIESLFDEALDKEKILSAINAELFGDINLTDEEAASVIVSHRMAENLVKILQSMKVKKTGLYKFKLNILDKQNTVKVIADIYTLLEGKVSDITISTNCSKCVLLFGMDYSLREDLKNILKAQNVDFVLSSSKVKNECPKPLDEVGRKHLEQLGFFKRNRR